MTALLARVPLAVLDAAIVALDRQHPPFPGLGALRAAVQVPFDSVGAAARIAELERALGGMLFAFDDGVGQPWSAPLLDWARTLCAPAEFQAVTVTPA